MTDFGPVYTLAERNRYKNKYKEFVKANMNLYTFWIDFKNYDTWKAVAMNYLGSEVDQTNLQEIELNLKLAKEKIRDHWFICMACKW